MFRSLTALAIVLVATGCASEDVAPAPTTGERIFVGEGTSPIEAEGERVLVALVLADDQMTFFACGDHKYPFAAWLTDDDGDYADNAEVAVDTKLIAGWQLGLTVSGNTATGTVGRDVDGTSAFELKEVAADDPSGAGLYGVPGGACPTGAVVTEAGVQGSYCLDYTPVGERNTRAQVTPLTPTFDGPQLRVEIYDANDAEHEMLLPRVTHNN